MTNVIIAITVPEIPRVVRLVRSVVLTIREQPYVEAAVSVGTNPTFSGRTRTVEAFVLDSEADLYGQHVAVDFVARLRGQHKFDSIDDLVAAMGKDTEKARQILASA